MTEKVPWFYAAKVERQRLHGTVEEPVTSDKLFILSEPELLVCKLASISPSLPLL